MKRFIVSILILTCAPLMLLSCWEHWRIEGISPGWIAEYYSLGENLGNCNRGTCVGIDVDMLSIAISPDFLVGPDAVAGNSAEYYALCEKYGDINPNGFVLRRAISNGTMALYVDKWPGEAAIAEQIDNIEMTADVRWDSEHPEGTLLNDIFELRYSTYYPFVQSGWSLDEPLTYIAKPLDELQAGEMKLLSTRFYMHTAKLPELETESYTLTVKLYFDTGKTSTYKFAMSNEPSTRYHGDTCKL